MRTAILTFTSTVVLLVAGLLALTYLCAYQLSPSANLCIATEILHRWQTLLSSVLATIAAAFTVAAIWSQSRQLDDHRREDHLRELQAFAATIQIDVLETATRLKTLRHISELEPPMSSVSSGLLLEAAHVDPALAIALHKHCLEVQEFARDFMRMSQTAAVRSGQLPVSLQVKRQQIDYRAFVLSHCFAVAVNQALHGAHPSGPYIERAKLEEYEVACNVGDKHRRYLEFLFGTTGLG